MEQKTNQKPNKIISAIIIIAMFVIGVQIGCQGMLKLLGV